MKKLLLIDLDDTLLKTAIWKQQVFSSIAEHINVNPFFVYTIYEELKWENSPTGWYHRFAQKLLPDNPKIVEEYILKSIPTMRLNLPVLQYLREFSGHKIVLTFGDEHLQNQKVKDTGLDKLIDAVIVTDKKKILTLQQRIQNQHFNDGDKNLYSDITIIDDDTVFLREVTNYYPWIRTIDPADM